MGDQNQRTWIDDETNDTWWMDEQFKLGSSQPTEWSIMYNDDRDVGTPQNAGELQEQLDQIAAYEDRSQVQKDFLSQKTQTRYWMDQISKFGGADDLAQQLFNNRDNQLRWASPRLATDDTIDSSFMNRMMPWANKGEGVLPTGLTNYDLQMDPNSGMGSIVNTYSDWQNYVNDTYRYAEGDIITIDDSNTEFNGTDTTGWETDWGLPSDEDTDEGGEGGEGDEGGEGGEGDLDPENFFGDDDIEPTGGDGDVFVGGDGWGGSHWDDGGVNDGTTIWGTDFWDDGGGDDGGDDGGGGESLTGGDTPVTPPPPETPFPESPDWRKNVPGYHWDDQTNDWEEDAPISGADGVLEDLPTGGTYVPVHFHSNGPPIVPVHDYVKITPEMHQSIYNYEHPQSAGSSIKPV